MPKFDKSSKKQTDYVEFTVKPLAYIGEYDEEALKAMGGFGDKTMRLVFYITEASLWRLKDFLEHCGLDVEEAKSLRELIEATPNCTFRGQIAHRIGNDNKTAFAEIVSTAADEDE